MTIVHDTAGDPWEVHASEPTPHGITLYRGYPQGQRPGGVPQAIPTPELIDLLWHLGSEDALRTLPISRGAITRLRRRYGITMQTQQRHLRAQERKAQAERMPAARKLALLITPDARHHDPAADYARMLIEELRTRAGLSRTEVAERVGMDYLRILELSDGAVGLTYPEQYTLERLAARQRLISTLEPHDHPTPERIRESRESAGISKSRAARLVRTDPKTWRQWETGEKVMSLHRWELWCYKLRDLQGQEAP